MSQPAPAAASSPPPPAAGAPGSMGCSANRVNTTCSKPLLSVNGAQREAGQWVPRQPPLQETGYRHAMQPGPPAALKQAHGAERGLTRRGPQGEGGLTWSPSRKVAREGAAVRRALWRKDSCSREAHQSAQHAGNASWHAAQTLQIALAAQATHGWQWQLRYFPHS
jgi:hypothetical protein